VNAVALPLQYPLHSASVAEEIFTASETEAANKATEAVCEHPLLSVTVTV
jgi:hypothetical protein